MRRWNNPLAALLAAALLWSLMLPSALAQEESALSIRTAWDLVDLAVKMAAKEREDGEGQSKPDGEK